MSLTPGTRISSYEIAAQIGKGGMEEVYRATDTKLKCEVAIKVLPAALANDPDRLARFQREAEVLASLNHPNIAAIHGLEESPAEAGHEVRGEGPADSLRQGYGRPPKSDTAEAGHEVRGEGPADVVAGFSRPRHALVMELVEGPTLAERLQLGVRGDQLPTPHVQLPGNAQLPAPRAKSQEPANVVSGLPGPSKVEGSRGVEIPTHAAGIAWGLPAAELQASGQ